ncbi:MAG: alpha/beta hydrolase [Chloroflexi bacterium]|nr:alpha/beta hydrolase [Chloroflexota bacterium]
MKSLVEKIGTQYIDVNGVRVRCMEAGTEAPVLLLHGFGECADVWVFSLENLSKHFKVYAVDLPGHGLSDKPKLDYSLPAGARFVADLMQALGLERVSIVGHSISGLMGLQVAMDSPEMIDRLVLVDTMGLNARTSLLYRLCTLPIIGEILIMPNIKAGLKRGMKRSFHNPDFITDEIVELNYGYLKMPGAKRAMLSIIRNGVSLKGPAPGVVVAEKLHQIKTPTLFIHGAQDRVVPLMYAEEASRVMPSATLKVINECGHCPHLEKPDEFCEEVIAFLDKSKVKTTTQNLKFGNYPLTSYNFVTSAYPYCCFLSLLLMGSNF